MERGQRVLVKSFDGRTAECRFIEQREATACVCSENEFMQAEQQGREAECIGFPVADIIEVLEEAASIK